MPLLPLLINFKEPLLNKSINILQKKSYWPQILNASAYFHFLFSLFHFKIIWMSRFTTIYIFFNLRQREGILRLCLIVTTVSDAMQYNKNNDVAFWHAVRHWMEKVAHYWKGNNVLKTA